MLRLCDVGETVRYLVRDRTSLKCAAHIEDVRKDGSVDSFCHMLATGGVRKLVPVDDPGGRRICLMCQNVYAKFNHGRFR